MSNSRPVHVNKGKCSCRGYNLEKFLQPNILILLAHESLHGYLIIQKLKEKHKPGSEKFDNTGVYRALQSMEKKNMVESRWDVAGAGAAKKTYSITPTGMECLSHWHHTLSEYRNTITDLIVEIETRLDMSPKK
jgi:PadR family transcriptional regulator PadR